MRENEFENGIRDLMTDFRLKPSEAVWAKIAPQITKVNHRRRWVLLFIPFAAILLGATYFYLHPGTADQPPTPKHLALQKGKGGDILHSSRDEAGRLKKKQEIMPPGTVRIKQEHVSTSPAAKTSHLFSHSPRSSRETPLPVLPEERSPLTSTDQQDTVADSGKQRETITGLFTSLVKNDVKNTPRTDSAGQLPSHDLRGDKPAKGNKWGFGAGVFYGGSNEVSSVQDILQRHPTPPVEGNISAMDTAGIASSPKKPHSYADAAFTIGMNIKKSISPKSSLLGGLYLTRITAIVRTGPPIDMPQTFRTNGISTTVQYYYTQGDELVQKNRYTFLQVPVQYQYSLTKKGSLSLSAGMSIMTLIGNNALAYDENNHVFYNNNSLLRKVQLTANAGVNIGFPLHRTTTLLLGPEIDYGLSRLYKYPEYDHLHLIRYGFKVTILSGK